jgi:hypothetical protein
VSFDTIPHCELMQCVARRIVDGDVLRLIKMWLTAPVEERDENGKRRLTGGKGRHCGTPQGGVASPLLANLYMNRLLKGWRNTKRGEQFRAPVVNYADDFVILSRGKAAEALDWTRQVVTRLGLTLNEAKISIKQAREESFNFLGYTFGPHRYDKDGHWYLGQVRRTRASLASGKKWETFWYRAMPERGRKCGIGSIRHYEAGRTSATARASVHTRRSTITSRSAYGISCGGVTRCNRAAPPAFLLKQFSANWGSSS